MTLCTDDLSACKSVPSSRPSTLPQSDPRQHTIDCTLPPRRKLFPGSAVSSGHGSNPSCAEAQTLARHTLGRCLPLLLHLLLSLPGCLSHPVRLAHSYSSRPSPNIPFSAKPFWLRLFPSLPKVPHYRSPGPLPSRHHEHLQVRGQG